MSELQYWCQTDSEPEQHSERSEFELLLFNTRTRFLSFLTIPTWAIRMTAIAFLITASPAWLSGFEMLMRSYGIPPAATASSALTGSTIHGYTTGEIWLSTLVAELFILVVWRNRNRQYAIRRE